MVYHQIGKGLLSHDPWNQGIDFKSILQLKTCSQMWVLTQSHVTHVHNYKNLAQCCSHCTDLLQTKLDSFFVLEEGGGQLLRCCPMWFATVFLQCITYTILRSMHSQTYKNLAQSSAQCNGSCNASQYDRGCQVWSIPHSSYSDLQTISTRNQKEQAEGTRRNHHEQFNLYSCQIMPYQRNPFSYLCKRLCL